MFILMTVIKSSMKWVGETQKICNTYQIMYKLFLILIALVNKVAVVQLILMMLLNK